MEDSTAVGVSKSLDINSNKDYSKTNTQVE
jgi:hypothetical protein